MGSLLAVRHVAFEDLDGFDAPFRKRGYSVDHIDAWYDAFPANPLSADIMVVLGAPIGVYEVADFPFINAEIEMVRRRLEAGRPVLGICFGAQVIAAAMGAQVVKGPSFEFGWAPIMCSPAGFGSPLHHYAADECSVFHCHGDTFGLPSEAVLLASSEEYPIQGFSYGPHLGMQFHGEVTARGLRRWYIGHSARIKAMGGHQRLIAATERHSKATEDAHDSVIADWLAQLG